MKKRKKILSVLIGLAMLMQGCAGAEMEVSEEKESVSEERTEIERTESVDSSDSKPQIYGESNELAMYDPENANYNLKVNSGEKLHDISELLYGIFIEDINFAADGGLYAEMIQNRSFEFTSLAAGNEKHAWDNVGEISAEVIKNDVDGRLNANNSNYMLLKNSEEQEAGIENCGFLDGMAVISGKDYNFSVWARGVDGYNGPLKIKIVCGEEVIAEEEISNITESWQKYNITLNSSVTQNNDVKLQVLIDRGSVAIDMVSLFPDDTYKDRENGMRRDLAEKLEDLKPAFLRFPGGCVIEGVSMENAYNWKDSVGADENGEPYLFNGTYGDIAARKQGQNIWTNEGTDRDPYPSYMTYGLGFYEYFQLAEDIGAIGVPVVNCGICCMAQGDGSEAKIGSEELQRYIKDALDLVEFCRGDENTVWGAVRIAMGHKEPFELKYIGIGNEQWGEDFFAHYNEFVEAFDKAKIERPDMYGDIELMFTAGPDDGDSGHGMHEAAYQEAQDWLREHPDKSIEDFAGAIDHHYYNTPRWFLTHNDYYDEANYSRSTEDMMTSRYYGGINVFLGEYAAQSNTLQAALAEASYMTGIERNGDVVVMAAYAPLFGNLTAMHWAPDLIWFNNNTVTPSINYYVQKLFSTNAGTALLSSELVGEAGTSEMNFEGKIGVGTWNTAAEFDNIAVIDNETGKELALQDFENAGKAEDWEKVSDGLWTVRGGKLVQGSMSTNTASFGKTGSVMYYGDKKWKNYTLTLEAKKTSGSEGFLIPFAIEDENNNYFWNIGGWNNTVSCLQQVSDGEKSDQLAGTTRNCTINTGETYKIKIVVKDKNVKCYLNDEEYINYDIEENTYSDCYQVVSVDENGDVIIKLVNVAADARTIAIDLGDVELGSGTVKVEQVAGRAFTDENILGQKENVSIDSFEISGVESKFNYTVPKYSVTVLRLKNK